MGESYDDFFSLLRTIQPIVWMNANADRLQGNLGSGPLEYRVNCMLEI